MILEQQYRCDIPQIPRYIPKELLKEFKRLFPGYELIYHEDWVWVMYHVKRLGCSPAEDVLVKQCTLPGDNLGMWVITYLHQQERDDNFREWNRRARDHRHTLVSKKRLEAYQLHKDMQRDWQKYGRRQSHTTLVEGGKITRGKLRGFR